MPVETEIKLRVSDDVAPLLASLGFLPEVERQLEVDQIYDLPGGQLRGADCLLRLRRSGVDWKITYKGPGTPGRHKSREELETGVGDGQMLAQILHALGYVPTFRYEKYRTTFRRAGEGAIVTLDETPMGQFLELEGPADWIDETALSLGFTAADYVTASYATLYQTYRRDNPGVPPDMTF